MSEPERNDRLEQAVRKRRARDSQHRQRGERGVGQNLAMIGALGWTIVTPILIGIFVGRWLDRVFGTAHFWLITLFALGLVAGCVMAWQRMTRE